MAPCKTQQELIERYGGIALDKQLAFGEAIGNNNWNVDMTQGTISFGEDLTFPVQVLGTISHSSQTWLWAWANPKSGLSENVTRQALQLKKYGEDNEIDFLRQDTFDFSRNDLHLIGLIACGMFNSSGYYIADYGQGAMLATIKSDKVDKARREDHHRILTVFPKLISQFDINHKIALSNYLTFRGYSVTDEGIKLTGIRKGNTITAQFDQQSRLVKLQG